METILITGVLGVSAVLALVIILPWRPPARLGVLWLFGDYQPRHEQPAAASDGRSMMARWDYGPGIEVCARCAAPTREGSCTRCGWRWADRTRAPWHLTSADHEALDAGLERSRAIAAEPRPGAVILPAPTEDISGSGRPSEPSAGAWLGAYAELAPEASPEPAQPRLGGTERRGFEVTDHAPEPEQGWDALELADPEPAQSPPGGIPPHGLAGMPDFPQVIALAPPRCPVCACRLFVTDEPHCSACGWQSPKYNIPWHLDAGTVAALEAAIEESRAIPSEQYYLLTGPAPPPLADIEPKERHHVSRISPPEPELPPGGDWAPGTGPPSDDDEDDPGAVWAPDGHAYGAMHWTPTRRATGADADVARQLADQDADAATFIARLGDAARAYLAGTTRAPGTAGPDDGKAQQ
jgi:hypothetical protein